MPIESHKFLARLFFSTFLGQLSLGRGAGGVAGRHEIHICQLDFGVDTIKPGCNLWLPRDLRMLRDTVELGKAYTIYFWFLSVSEIQFYLDLLVFLLVLYQC